MRKREALSLTAVIFLFAVMGVAILSSGTDTDEIDELCDQNDSIIIKRNGTWQCSNATPMFMNYNNTGNTSLVYSRMCLDSMNCTTYMQYG